MTDDPGSLPRPAPSTTHLVLIPSYNPGPKVYDTVRAARAQWAPVWVVVDGSTDGSAEGLQAMAAHDAGLRVLVLPRNQGKGAAVLHGLDPFCRGPKLFDVQLLRLQVARALEGGDLTLQGLHLLCNCRAGGALAALKLRRQQ